MELFSKISNEEQYVDNTGNSIIAFGDSVILAVGVYKCTQGTCASSNSMLYTDELFGEIRCLNNDVSCVLNGENNRRVMRVYGTTTPNKLVITAPTFRDGEAYSGGGVYIYYDAMVNINVVTFVDNKATGRSSGGGTIYVGSGSTVNVWGTSFEGNLAVSGDGDDIYRYGGTITIHDTCISPFSLNAAIKGSTLDTDGNVEGSKDGFVYSYKCSYFTCASGFANPTAGPLLPDCEECVPGRYAESGSGRCNFCNPGEQCFSSPPLTPFPQAPTAPLELHLAAPAPQESTPSLIPPPPALIAPLENICRAKVPSLSTLAKTVLRERIPPQPASPFAKTARQEVSLPRCPLDAPLAPPVGSSLQTPPPHVPFVR